MRNQIFNSFRKHTHNNGIPPCRGFFLFLFFFEGSNLISQLWNIIWDKHSNLNNIHTRAHTSSPSPHSHALTHSYNYRYLMIIILKWPESMSAISGQNCENCAEHILPHLPLHSFWILWAIFGSLCHSKCTTVFSIPPKRTSVHCIFTHTLTIHTHKPSASLSIILLCAV